MRQVKCIYKYYGDNIYLERIDDGDTPFSGFKYRLNNEDTTVEEFDRIKRLTYIAIETHYMEKDDGSRYEVSICYKNNKDDTTDSRVVVESIDGMVDGVELLEYVKETV